MTSGRDTVLHLAGPVRLGDDDVRAEAWVVDGRLTFTRPTLPGRDVVRVEGWAVPGLVDVHCHVGLGATGAVSREEAVRQAVTDRDSGVLLQRDAGSPLDTRWVHERADLPRLVRCGTHVARPKRYLHDIAGLQHEPRRHGIAIGLVEPERDQHVDRTGRRLFAHVVVDQVELRHRQKYYRRHPGRSEAEIRDPS